MPESIFISYRRTDSQHAGVEELHRNHGAESTPIAGHDFRTLRARRDENSPKKVRKRRDGQTPACCSSPTPTNRLPTGISGNRDLTPTGCSRAPSHFGLIMNARSETSSTPGLASQEMRTRPLCVVELRSTTTASAPSLSVEFARIRW